MIRLDLIRFTTLHGRPCNRYGLQEVEDEEDRLLRLYDDHADQLLGFPKSTFEFVRTLGEIDEDDSDTFWELLEGVTEIKPIAP